MFRLLVSRNDDIRRLIDKGFAIGFGGNHVIVRDIPYLDAGGNLCWGAFASQYETIDGERIRPQNHQMSFAGGMPHQIDGTPVANMGSTPHCVPLGGPHADVNVERIFSHKPFENGAWRDYVDHFEKIERYLSSVSGPAMAKFGDEANPYTFRIVDEVEEDPIFKFGDTLTTRAEISELAQVFANEVVAVIGLGGTGAYILDFMVKTRVPEVRGFDMDHMRVHNAFRSPGRVIKDEFGKPKAEVYQDRYENFRHGLKVQAKFIDESSEEELKGVTFAFVAVDKGASRKSIFALLAKLKIPYIDVGMGLKKKNGKLRGSLRTTHYSVDRGDEMRERNLAETGQDDENIYAANIQIGELNALNACIAVVRYKQLRGFYAQDADLDHLVLNLATLKLIGDSGVEEELMDAA